MCACCVLCVWCAAVGLLGTLQDEGEWSDWTSSCLPSGLGCRMGSGSERYDSVPGTVAILMPGTDTGD
jgi:hypothetical protein